MIFQGRYIYVVTSGRIKLGRRYFIAGEEISLTEEQAVSLYGTGQLRFKKVIFTGNLRNPAPGETLEMMSKDTMRFIKICALRRMAKQKYGILQGNRKELIQEIQRVKMRIRNGLLHTD